MLFQLQEILICHVMWATRQFFRILQSSPFFFAEACVIALLQGAPVIWSQASALGRSYMMLGAIPAAINERYANVDEFIELQVQRAPDAGIEAEKILEHLRTVRQRFLRGAGLAVHRAIVNLFAFRIGVFRFNQCDAWSLCQFR